MAKQQPHQYFQKWLEKQLDLRQADIAKSVNVHPSMVVFWKTGQQPISAEKALLLESQYKARRLCAEKLCPLIKQARDAKKS